MDEMRSFRSAPRALKKRGRSFCDGGPEEGHRRGDAGGRQLPKKHSRAIFV